MRGRLAGDVRTRHAFIPPMHVLPLPRYPLAPLALLLALCSALSACGGGSGGSLATGEASPSTPGSSATGGGTGSPAPSGGSSGTGSTGSTLANAESVLAEPAPAMVLSDTVGLFRNEYPTVQSGAYKAINNNWNANECTQPAEQRVGLSGPRSDGSHDFRITWNYLCTDWSLIGYPSVVYGVPSSPAVGPAPGAALPRQISQLKTLRSRHLRVEGTADGGGYLALDAWTSKLPSGSLAKEDRDAEIIIPLYPINGFGIPKDPPEAMVGREHQLQRIGWNPKGYLGRQTIGGRQYDAYYYPPGTHSSWKFISFLPIDYPYDKAYELDWKPLLDFLIARGILSGSSHMANIEIGVENYVWQFKAVGDWTVRGYRVDVE